MLETITLFNKKALCVSSNRGTSPLDTAYEPYLHLFKTIKLYILSKKMPGFIRIPNFGQTLNRHRCQTLLT